MSRDVLLSRNFVLYYVLINRVTNANNAVNKSKV